jgi:GntR family transcriptional regulator
VFPFVADDPTLTSSRHGALWRDDAEARSRWWGYVRHVSIDHESAVPPYRQLAAILREQIRSGELAPGATVPPVKRLRAEYGVAETTARKAVALLRDEGLVETVMGWGSFVRK